MNKIQSRLLALVMSIFLIQAADPPYDKNTGTLLQTSYLQLKNLQFRPTRESHIEKIAPTTTADLDKNNSDDLKRLQDYLINIQKERNSTRSSTPAPNIAGTYDAINRFLQRQGKTQYEKLLEKDFVRPLLKLYEKETHTEPFVGNTTTTTDSSVRISKEDYVENFHILTKDELNTLIHGSEIYQHNNNQNVKQEISRRDDGDVENKDDEHIGEILPSNFDRNQKPRYHQQRYYQPVRYNAKQATFRTRKSYDYDELFRPEKLEPARYRKPVIFPVSERHRPDFEPTAEASTSFSAEQFFRRPDYEAEEVRNGYVRSQRLALPSSEVPSYRIPRRYRGYRDAFQEAAFQPTAREPFYESTRFQQQQQQQAWPGGRRPRVIFPSDLVAFREPATVQQEEPDWLAGDNNLQDIQEQDTRDRGKEL